MSKKRIFIVENSIDKVGYQIREVGKEVTLQRVFARRERDHQNRFCFYELKYDSRGYPYYITLNSPSVIDEGGAKSILKKEIRERAKQYQDRAGIDLFENIK